MSWFEDREQLLQVREGLEHQATVILRHFEGKRVARDVAEAGQRILDLCGALKQAIDLSTPGAVDAELVLLADEAADELEDRGASALPDGVVFRLREAVGRRETVNGAPVTNPWAELVPVARDFLERYGAGGAFDRMQAHEVDAYVSATLAPALRRAVERASGGGGA